MQKIVKLLDTVFEFQADKEDVLDYIDYFMDSYGEIGNKIEEKNLVKVQVAAGNVPEHLENSETVKVHTTKHPYWNFSGEYTEKQEGRTVLWPTRNILITLDSSATNIAVIYCAKEKAVFVGEAIFHMMRGIALYKRDNTNANFLHASGVIVNQKGFLFTGAVSAGKTTLLLEGIAKYGATPLTNDRIFLKCDEDEVRGYSWPSYASFCEGTILQYPGLTEGANTYQKDENYKYRTIDFPGELKEAYDKGSKRIYPMMFMCDWLSTKFVNSSKIHTVFISKLDINAEKMKIKELSKDEDYDFIYQSLESQLFDSREPSFMPWHGLKLRDGCTPVGELIDKFYETDCKIVEVVLSPEHIEDFMEYIKINY